MKNMDMLEAWDGGSLGRHWAAQASPNARQWRTECLLVAIRTGDVEYVEGLLKKSVDIDWSATLLHHAARYGHAGIATLLLGAGADVHQCNEDGWTPLLVAALHGRTAFAGLLLGAGAKVDAVGGCGCTPLHAAARCWTNTLDVAELLLEAGADVNQLDKIQFTPLLEAASRGKLALVKLFCSYGATRTGREVTVAMNGGQSSTAAWLTATANYTTPLHYVAQDLVPPLRARALLRAGAGLHAARAAGGPTPLSLARELEARGKAPAGSTAWLILTHSRARLWLRTFPRLAGRLIVMRKQSSEKLYAPGGAGAEASRAEFERLSSKRPRHDDDE